MERKLQENIYLIKKKQDKWMLPYYKLDTNFDNAPMLKILDKLGYTYCGEVFFRGSARKAFEKILQ